MRIRKRQVPLPLSSLSPVPLSDPPVQLPFNRNPPLILSDDDDTAAYFNAPASPPPQFQPIQLTATHTANLLQREESSNDTWVAKIDALIPNEKPQQEKTFPPKKNKGSSKSNEEETDSKKKKKEDGKKRGKGGIMEGSRCSRVNGRGWRCWQQTLVGYSLCEHHLGKGRLRSMTSVRSRSKPQDSHSSEDDPTFKVKKRAKLGMVKARSMSSLLGQHNDNNTN